MRFGWEGSRITGWAAVAGFLLKLFQYDDSSPSQPQVSALRQSPWWLSGGKLSL